jgi:hypothetical protein
MRPLQDGKRCRMVVDSGDWIAYLCRPCARGPEYEATPAAKR